MRVKLYNFKIFKIITLLCILLNLSLSYAQLPGAITEGSAGVDGFLKKVLFSWTLPIGKLSSSYGYEVIDFKESKHYESDKNKALYCQGGNSFSNSSSIFGASYGGGYNLLTTFGSCNTPEDYTGGFLDFTVGYARPTGKFTSATGKVGLHLGFNMQTFNELVKRDFHTNNYSNFDHHTKVKWAVSHLLKYSSTLSKQKNAKLIYKITSKIFSNLFGYIYSNDNSLKLSKNEFTQNEIDHIVKNKESLGLDPKKYFEKLYYNSRRDSSFYSCEDEYPDCEMVWLDTQNLLLALYESFGNCHSVSGGISLETNLSLYNFKLGNISIRVSASAGYSYYVHEKSFKSFLPNVALTDRHFWRHNPNDFLGFVADKLDIEKKLGISRECSRAGSAASRQFGTFLATLINFNE